PSCTADPSQLAALRSELGKSTPRTRPGAQDVPRHAAPDFVDDADRAGLRFTYENGKTSSRQIPETMGGGVALLDYDGDGRTDVYAVRGGRFPPEPDRAGGDRLFRNRGDGTFEDVTGPSGVGRAVRGYGHGVTVGDYDNDGRPDLFL